MRKKIYWIRKTHLFSRDEYICSSCGHREYKPLEVCPKCGAEPEGVKYKATWVDEAEFFDIINE